MCVLRYFRVSACGQSRRRPSSGQRYVASVILFSWQSARGKVTTQFRGPLSLRVTPSSCVIVALVVRKSLLRAEKCERNRKWIAIVPFKDKCLLRCLWFLEWSKTLELCPLVSIITYNIKHDANGTVSYSSYQQCHSSSCKLSLSEDSKIDNNKSVPLIPSQDQDYLLCSSFPVHVIASQKHTHTHPHTYTTLSLTFTTTTKDIRAKSVVTNPQPRSTTQALAISSAFNMTFWLCSFPICDTQSTHSKTDHKYQGISLKINGGGFCSDADQWFGDA